MASRRRSAIVVVVVVARDLCECEDVVPLGLGNVPYLTRVMIAATAASHRVCRDAEEGADEEGGIDYEEEGTLPGTTGEGRSEGRTRLLRVETGRENVSGRRKEEVRKRTGQCRRGTGR